MGPQSHPGQVRSGATPGHTATQHERACGTLASVDADDRALESQCANDTCRPAPRADRNERPRKERIASIAFLRPPQPSPYGDGRADAGLVSRDDSGYAAMATRVDLFDKKYGFCVPPSPRSAVECVAELSLGTLMGRWDARPLLYKISRDL